MRKQQRRRLGIVDEPGIEGTPVPIRIGGSITFGPYHRIDQNIRPALSEIVWVRLVSYHDVMTGIGFRDGKLVHLEADASGVRQIREVSVLDSLKVMRACAKFEPQVNSDIESDSNGWEYWLEMVEAALTLKS